VLLGLLAANQMQAFKDIVSADQSKITHNRAQTFFKPKNDLKLLLLP